MSFSIDNLNSSAIALPCFQEKSLLQTGAHSAQSYFPISSQFAGSLEQVEKTQARDSKLFQQPFLEILLLHHRQLLRLHLPPVHRQLPIHPPPDLEHKLFRRMTRQ